MEKKLLLQELSDAVAARERITKKKADAFARSFFEIIEDGLLSENFVKIKSFGTFKIISVSERESVNINTGERFQIDGHSKVTFTPDSFLKELVNRPFSHFQTVVLNEETDIEELDGVTDEAIPSFPESPELQEETDSPAEPVAKEEQTAIPATQELSAETVATKKEERTPEPTEKRPDQTEETMAAIPETSPATPTVPDTEEETPVPLHQPKKDTAKETPSETGTEQEETKEATCISATQLLPERNDTEDKTVATAAEETRAPKEKQLSETPTIPQPDINGNSRQKFNWWKATVIFACILFLMILSYFAGYFRLFCPCEFQWAIYKIQQSPSATETTVPPTRPVTSPANQAGKAMPSGPITGEKKEAVKAQPVPQPAKKEQAVPTNKLPKEETEPAKTTSPVSPKGTDGEKTKRQKKATATTGQVKNGKYIITGTRQTYTMSHGETLRTVAEHVYGSRGYAQYIIVHNKITNPDVIAAGTVIKLPELELAPKDSSGSR